MLITGNRAPNATMTGTTMGRDHDRGNTPAAMLSAAREDYAGEARRGRAGRGAAFHYAGRMDAVVQMVVEAARAVTSTPVAVCALGGYGRHALRRAGSPSPANRHLRRSPRCRTPGFSSGQMRTCAWAYSEARATERASGRTSPSCHLRQERPPFVQAAQSKCPSIQAPSLADASGWAVLPSPQSRAAPDPCAPAAEPSGSGPRLVHNPSALSGSQRSPAVRRFPGRKCDPGETGPRAEP